MFKKILISVDQESINFTVQKTLEDFKFEYFDEVLYRVVVFA